jgi:mono/diheme cytochrome c family protein
MAHHALRVALVAASAALWTACGSARRGEPLIGPKPPMSEKLALGERAFDRACSQCHPGGEAGLGPSLNNKPLPGFAVKIQVRNGVGAMPRFRSEDLSDDQLSAITSYMAWLRKQR